MNPKKTKHATRVLLSLLIAFALVGLPAGVFAGTTETTVADETNYARMSFVMQDSYGMYWMFYAVSDTETDRTGNNVDNSHNHIYAKRASTLAGLETATPMNITASYNDGNRERIPCVYEWPDGTMNVLAAGGGGAHAIQWYQTTNNGSTWTDKGTWPVSLTGNPSDHDIMKSGNKLYYVHDFGGNIYLTKYSGSWQSDVQVSTAASVYQPKITAGGGQLYVAYADGDNVYLANSSDDGATWQETTVAAKPTGYYIWDPDVIYVNGIVYVFHAPYDGTNQQQYIAMTYSSNPTNANAWVTPTQITTGTGGGTTDYWWDMWPTPYYDGSDLYLFYTSDEPGDTSTPDAHGVIKMLKLDFVGEELTTGEQTFTYNNVEVTVNATADNQMVIYTYPDNPYPDAGMPNDTLGFFMEIVVNDTTEIAWPIYVKVYYTLDDLEPGQGEGELVGLAHYDGTEWLLLDETGVNTTDQNGYAGYLWANLTSLSPFAGSGGLNPPTNLLYVVDPNTGVECCIDLVNASFAASDSDGLVDMTIEFYDPSDVLVYTYSKDPGGAVAATFDVTDVGPFCEVGAWTVAFNATDSTGAWTNDVATLTVVDTIPPEITYVGVGYYWDAPPQTFYVGDYDFEFFAVVEDICVDNITANGGSVYVYIVDAPTASGYTTGDTIGLDFNYFGYGPTAFGWYSLSPFTNDDIGLWEFTVNATDGNGNDVNTSVLNFTVAADPYDPVVTKEYGEPTYVAEDPEYWHSMGGSTMARWITSSTDIWINASDAEGATVYYRVWNFTHGWGGWNPYDMDPDPEVAWFMFRETDRDGECKHKIEYYAMDESGNTSETYYQFVYIDNTPPDLTVEVDSTCMVGDAYCITNETDIHLIATDGEWDLQNMSCPSGIQSITYRNWWNGSWSNWATVKVTGGRTPDFSTIIHKDEDCLHYLEAYATDNLGWESAIINVTLFVDTTPPEIIAVWGEADYSEEWGDGVIAKNVTDGCVDIYADIAHTGCCPDEGMTVVLEVDVINSSALDGITTVKVNMTYDTQLGLWTYTWCDTAENGYYHFRVIATDCVGNQNTVKSLFAIKPLRDVDIIEMTDPDPTRWHPEMPTSVTATIKNNGVEDIEEPINVHLQIYREDPFELEQYELWDFEECILNTWEAIDHDGDGMTWYWTEKRSYSPTHSFHSHPDNLPSYEAYSDDSLILKDWYEIPAFVDDNEVQVAYLTFAHWCEGEYDGTNVLDYGMVYIHNSTGVYEVAGPFYSTEGEWETFFGFDGFDISDWIGDEIKIEFRWYSDATGNFEGWYIDDVNIDISYHALQPLVFQGYKYVDGLKQNESKVVTFPLDFEPDPDTWYFIEIYSDLADDIDGPADANYDEKIDPRSGNRYKDPWNGVNHSIYFGDVCDAAVTGITAPDDVELDHNVGYVEIPINVTVENTGTLDKEIPVKVSAKHKLTNYIFKDDVESGELDAWGSPGMWVAGEELYEDVWTITDQDFFSPVHSWYTQPRSEGIGQAKLLTNLEINPFEVQGGLKWSANIKWNLPAGAGVVPAFLASTYYWDLSINGDARENPWQGSSGWTEFDADQFIRDNSLYWEYNTIWGGFGQLNSLAELIEAMNNRYGPPGQDVEDFTELKFGFLVEAFDGLGASQGFWFDDFALYNEYAGATVWTETKTITLDAYESGYIDFIWNATEYCDYVITAEIDLDCDQDPSNNEAQTTTRIHEWLYKDSWEDVSFDDNTCGGDTQWQIVDECSICPDNSFWWNGVGNTYTANRNDILQIDEVFNFTGVTRAYLNFSTYYYIEEDYDYGYVEVSNDSGDTWFIIETLTNTSGPNFIDISILLEPGVTFMESPYTGMLFDMPADFFTEDMHFRFRFVSDEAENWKGWYIDDVQLNMFNGTWNELFFDDMEDDDSIDNWLTYYICYGNHWHEEDTYNAPYPSGDTAWWNGDNRSWIGQGTLYFANYKGAGFWDGTWAAKFVAGSGSWNYWFGIGGERLVIPNAGYVDAWLNKTIDLSLASGTTTVTVGTSVNAAAQAHTHWFTVTNSTYTMNFPINHAIAGHYLGGSQFDTFDITPFAGQTGVTMGFHANYTAAGGEQFAQWLLWVNSSGPVIPYYNYYNNVDEKLIFDFDLTHAFEAILHFDHNYAFADGDVGYVEVWTGSEWRIIFVAKGASDWSHAAIDISELVDHDAMTKIRFRFVSDSAGTDMGWFVDNISIDGKVDYTAPTASHTISPATPNGKNGWYTSDVTITLTASDNTKVEAIKYRIDGGSWLTYTAPFTIGIEGSHTVEYYAIDQVGNAGAIGSVSFKIDKTNPTASISVPQAGYIYFFGRELMPRLIFKDKALIIGGLVAQATAADAMSGLYVVKFNEDGTTFAEDTTSPYQAPLPFSLFKAHELTVTAEDFAGNTYTTSAVPYFKIF